MIIILLKEDNISTNKVWTDYWKIELRHGIFEGLDFK